MYSDSEEEEPTSPIDSESEEEEEDKESEEDEEEAESPPPPPSALPAAAAPPLPGAAQQPSPTRVGFSGQDVHVPANRPAAAKAAVVPPAVAALGADRETGETVKQQLRGIFAAHDFDHDGMLTRAQLVDVVSMLGLKATDKLVAKFFPGSSKAAAPQAADKLVDLPTFVRVACEELVAAPDVVPELIELFQVFDPPNAEGKRSGTITLKTLRHIMLEVLTPDRLTREEFDDYLDCAGLKTEEFGMEGQVRIDYLKLASNLLIGKSPQNMVC